MGVFETLLLLAGSAIAIAVIGMVAYRGFSGRKTAPITAVSFSPVSSAATESIGPEQTSAVAEHPATKAEIIAISEPPQVESFAAPQMTAIPSAVTAMASQEEAPPPFPEESNAKTSIPTDVTAVSNIASPTESATPVLVISTPKIKTARASRKRLPSSATPGTTAPRRRRTSSKAQVSAPQVSVAPPTSTDASVHVEQQE